MRRDSRPLILLGIHNITIQGESFAYTLKRSSVARHLRLEGWANTGLTVIVPRTYNTKDLPKLLESKKTWILSKLNQFAAKQPRAVSKQLESGDVIPYLGRSLELVMTDNIGTPDIKLQEEHLLINLGSQDGQLKLVLEDWYRRQAERYLRERVGVLCLRVGVTYGRLTVRGARTRWGSCSRKGNISLNWKLMMLTEPVIDYIIIHELVHLKELNHSKKFWSIVAGYCPQWREHRKWLRDHEAGLSDGLFD
jgi:predicted metal-dependent hydrolase